MSTVEIGQEGLRTPVPIPRTQLKTQTATDVPLILAVRRQRQDPGARWLLGERPCRVSAVGLYTYVDMCVHTHVFTYYICTHGKEGEREGRKAIQEMN